MLPPSLREKISSLFNIDAYTEYDFLRTSADELSLPTFRKELSSYIRYKDFIFSSYEFKHANDIFSGDDSDKFVSTSLDFLFGGPFKKCEITSIEGCSGVGKTRICLKIAHEISQTGNVLFIDTDFTLQNKNIMNKIMETLGLENRTKVKYGIDEIANFNIVCCNDLLEIYNVINEYIHKCEEFVCSYPDLIVIDSLMGLFQSNTNKKGPGSAMLQEFAIEIKNLAQKYNCLVLVTNALRRDKRNSPFLGRIYESLWHQILQIFSRNYITSKCTLVASPRYKEQTKFCSILSLKEYDELITDINEI